MKKIFMVLVFGFSICGVAKESLLTPGKELQKVYIQPDKIALWDNQIFVDLGPLGWLPIDHLGADSNGYHVFDIWSDPDDIAPGIKQCCHCGAPNKLSANVCWKCKKPI